MLGRECSAEVCSSYLTSKSGGGEHIDDVLDCFVGAVVGEFELAVWAVFEVRLVVEARSEERRVGKEGGEWRQQRNLDNIRGEAVGIAGSVTHDKSVHL